MADKKRKEDNRDIFEKALDNAPVAGMLGGAALGALGMRKLAKKMGLPRGPQASGMAVGGVTGATAGMLGGYAAKGSPKRDKRRK